MKYVSTTLGAALVDVATHQHTRRPSEWLAVESAAINCGRVSVVQEVYLASVRLTQARSTIAGGRDAGQGGAKEPNDGRR